MVFRKLFLMIALMAFNSSYAAISHGDDYAGVLNDPNDGLTLLETAQDSLFNIDHALPGMMQIAAKASLGTASQDELQAMDATFQQLKHDFGNALSHYSLAGSLIFNQGNLTVFKEGKSINVDLNHKDPYSLGFNMDDLKSVEHARTADYHLTIAIGVVKDWLSDAEKNAKTHALSVSHQSINHAHHYFNSCVLHLKTSLSVDSVLQSVQSEQKRLFHDLNELRMLAIAAEADSISASQRDDMETEFEALSGEMYRAENTDVFNDIKAFDGSVLEVYANDGSYRSFDLPELSLKLLGIGNDDLLSTSDALQTLTDLNLLKDQIHLWLVTGKFDLSNSTLQRGVKSPASRV